jgi:Family of unknown function (DUF6526)
MSEQNFKNHGRYLPFYHFIATTAIGYIIVSAIINLVYSLSHNNNGIGNAIIACLTGMVLLIIWWYCRAFALKAQDRAIRAEENFRHFIATGKPFDSRLRMGQIIALRFAGDDEFVTLAKKAADENLKAKEIKMAIKNWKEDNNRV